MRYNRRRMVIKYAYYNFLWYAINIKGVYIIYINSKLNEKEKQRILHRLLKA